MLEEEVCGVGGPIETVGESHVAKVISIAMSSPFGVGGSAFRTLSDRPMFVDTVAFPAYKRETLKDVGMYDEELIRNQDDEYNYRIRKMGGKILLSPDIRSRYYSRASFDKLWSQYYQYGFWKVRVLQKHPRQMSIRQFVPPVFVSSLLITALLSIFWLCARYLLAILFGFYLIANLFASAWTASRREWRYFLLLPLAYAIVHVAYGTGFVVGIFKFINRWGDKDGKVPSWDESEFQTESSN